MSYLILKDNLKKEDVLSHFLKIERNKAVGLEEEIDCCLQRKGADFIECTKRWSEKRKDTNPALIWTIGIKVGIKEDNRSDKINKWILAEAPVGKFYSEGVNYRVNQDLIDRCKGNVSEFANKYSKYHDEFNKNLEFKDESHKIVIGILQKENTYIESIELIDGIHRLVSLILNGDSVVKAYIGILKN